MAKVSSFNGLEGMIILNKGKVGVLSNNHQFISYNSFNVAFSAQIAEFFSAYEHNMKAYVLGYFNDDAYSHPENFDWQNSSLILVNTVYKKLKTLEQSLPEEIKRVNEYPVEKCMSSYMGMRLLSIFGSKAGYYPVLIIKDKKPVVINFNTITSSPDFEKEIKHLIISSPLFITCKSEAFKMGVIQYCFDGIDINKRSQYSVNAPETQDLAV